VCLAQEMDAVEILALPAFVVIAVERHKVIEEQWK
jgi:hypothetical protein